MTTPRWRTERPGADEFAPFYAGYIEGVPLGDLVVTLRTQMDETLALLRGLPEARGDHRYAPGKWSIKDVLGHVCDSERVFAYRLMRIARGDATPLPGFEQDGYVARGDFGSRSLASLTEEFEALRRATIALVSGLDDAAMAHRGSANGVQVSARALAYIIAGHEWHHVQVLRGRYL
jgi:uncharacterized damage-inducible protein DinB